MATDTRDRLVRTTSRLLRKQGYGATGLNQVMAEAEAPKGSMYFHFPGGKEQLAAAALDHFTERVAARLDEILTEYPTVSEAVTRFFDDYVAHLERTSYSEGCAVATVALDAAGHHPALAEATGRALRRWTEQMATRLEAEGRSAEEAHGLATLVIAAIEGTIVMGKGERSTEPLESVREVLKGVLARPSNVSRERRPRGPRG